MFLDKKHKLLVCTMAKVGCSTVKSLLWTLNGKQKYIGMDIHKVAKILKLKFVNQSSYDVDTYFKVIVVRDPIDRLWSAYLDKLYTSTELAKYFSDIFSDERGKLCQDSITFLDLLRKTIQHPGFNVHIQPYMNACNPCVGYDFVVKLETFYEDMSYVLKRVKATNDFDLPRQRMEAGEKVTRGKRFLKNGIAEINKFIQKKYMVNGQEYYCVNSSEYANRLWKRAIWRNLIPQDAPYPKLLLSGLNVTADQLLGLYEKVTKGDFYEYSAYTPQLKEVIIRKAFLALTTEELRQWFILYGDDFKAYGYTMPPYLARLSDNLATN